MTCVIETLISPIITNPLVQIRAIRVWISASLNSQPTTLNQLANRRQSAASLCRNDFQTRVKVSDYASGN
jgi:hypothetical protein